MTIARVPNANVMISDVTGLLRWKAELIVNTIKIVSIIVDINFQGFQHLKGFKRKTASRTPYKYSEALSGRVADVELYSKSRNGAAVFEVATGSKGHASTAVRVDDRTRGMVSNNCILDLMTLINPDVQRAPNNSKIDCDSELLGCSCLFKFFYFLL